MARIIDGPSPIEWLLAELERMPGCSTTKQAVVDLIRSMAGQRVYVSRKATVVPYRVAMARRMLDNGLSAAEVRKRIGQAFERSPDFAERVVTQALASRDPQQDEPAAAQTSLFDEAAHG